jgi:hypothetical protein
VLLHDRRFFERIRLLRRAALQFYPARPKFERIRQRRSAAGGSCSRTTEDFLNEFGCSGEQPSSFILHDRNFEQIRRQKRKFFFFFFFFFFGALRITLTSFPFLSWHNCDEHENGAKCDVRCWVRCAECGVQLMGFVHQTYGLKSERELALCISNEWVSAHSVGMQIDSAKQVSTKK